MAKINGDLIPSASGTSHLGVDATGASAFDADTITPFGHIHLTSGVWHDPATGQSGVIRYSQAASEFQVSTDGGKTFTSIGSGGEGSGVLGVNGIGVEQVAGSFVVDGAALSGLALANSGLNAINGDTGPNIDIEGVNGIGVSNPSPGIILLNAASLSGIAASESGVVGVNGIEVNQVAGEHLVDGAALSGLIVPSGGIGGINGQIGPHLELQGVNGAQVLVLNENELLVDVASLSGLIPANTQVVQSFTNTSGVVVTHNLGSTDVLVQVQDASVPPQFIIPDLIEYTTINKVTVGFNTQRSGRVLVWGSGTLTTVSSSTQSGVLGVNGIGVEQVDDNFVVDGAALSGLAVVESGVVGVNGIEVNQIAGEHVVDGAALSGLAVVESGVVGVNGIEVNQVGGEHLVDGAALSGLIDPSGGIGGINGQVGPHIEVVGVNGVAVSVSAKNELLFDGAGASGSPTLPQLFTDTAIAQYTESFTSISSGLFEHNLNTPYVQVQVLDDSSPPQIIIPDAVIRETFDAVSIIFNSPRTGVAIIHGPSGVGFQSAVTSRQYAQSFTNANSVLVNHNLGTTDVFVQVKDNSSPPLQIVPDSIEYTDANNVTVGFNNMRSGRVVVVGSGVSTSLADDQVTLSRRYSLLVG